MWNFTRNLSLKVEIFQHQVEQLLKRISKSDTKFRNCLQSTAISAYAYTAIPVPSNSSTGTSPHHSTLLEVKPAESDLLWARVDRSSFGRWGKRLVYYPPQGPGESATVPWSHRSTLHSST